jgi:YrbI family 3-deoxy-D-manno-octulosonate 8-phosphate phosphatase
MIDFKKIKLLVCDCDGVLTDGSLIYSKDGEELKIFSAHDGLGFQMLKHSSITPIIITGRNSQILSQRCNDLGIELLFQGVKNKKKVLDEILLKFNYNYCNVAYIGDDWNDYPAMQCCAFKIAPQNANKDIKLKVDFVTENTGGNGAVREALEYILKNSDEFENVLNSFLNELANS